MKTNFHNKNFARNLAFMKRLKSNSEIAYCQKTELNKVFVTSLACAQERGLRLRRSEPKNHLNLRKTFGGKSRKVTDSEQLEVVFPQVNKF